MRFDTHRVSVYLVEMLKSAGVVRDVTVDGGDIIQFTMRRGETVSLYLIESAIALYEIEGIVRANTAAGVHTLFILWCDMLLPRDGQRVAPADWLEALLALYGDRVYAFDAFGAEIVVFPVYFERQGYDYVARFGENVDPARLGCATVETESRFLRGTWRAAGFDGNHERVFQTPAAGRVTMAHYYAVLGLNADAKRETVRRAYRRLARLHHPDVNDDPDAHASMQAINEAYERIRREMDEA